MFNNSQPQQNGQQFEGETCYQINTGKIIKGHKLTMRELKQKQKIKSINSSPTHRNKQQCQLDMSAPKITDFSQKYKGLQTLDDQESLIRFIIYQRQKHSRQSARGIKLFSCQKRSQTLQQDSFINHHITFSARSTRKALSSQSHRKNYTSIGSTNQKNIGIQTPNQNRILSNKITFISDNLGKRMNQYLNIILHKKQIAEMSIKQDQIKEQAQLYQLKNQLVNQVRIMNKNIKIKTSAFYRQMKKKKQSRLGSQTISSSSKSNQLVKQLIKKVEPQVKNMPLNRQKHFLKSNSESVRKNEANQTGQSFYSRRQRQKKCSNNEIQSLMSIIYKK